jgi:hypothetical protein
MLNQFLNTKRKLADEPLIDLNTAPSAENELIGLNIEMNKKRKEKKKLPSFPLRRSKRKVKPSKKILWETW